MSINAMHGAQNANSGPVLSANVGTGDIKNKIVNVEIAKPTGPETQIYV
jgi:hypothetical protein